MGPKFDSVSLVRRDSIKVVSLANSKKYAIKWTNQSLVQIRGTKRGKTRVHRLCLTFVTFCWNFTTHRDTALRQYSSITLRFHTGIRVVENTDSALLSYEIRKTSLAKKLRPPNPTGCSHWKRALKLHYFRLRKQLCEIYYFTLGSQIPREYKKKRKT